MERLLLHKILRRAWKCPGHWSCVLMIRRFSEVAEVLVDEAGCRMKGWREGEQQMGVLVSVCRQTGNMRVKPGVWGCD